MSRLLSTLALIWRLARPYFVSEDRWAGRIPIPEDVITNLAFGGDDGRTIYVTAGKTLFTTRVATPGQVAWPKWKQP